MRQEAVLGEAGSRSALEWQVLKAKTCVEGLCQQLPQDGAGVGDLVPEFWRSWVVWGQVFPPLHPQDQRGKGR